MLKSLMSVVILVHIFKFTSVVQEQYYSFTEDEIYLLSQLLAGSGDHYGDGEFDFTWTLQVGHILSEWQQEQISLVLEVVMNRIDDSRWANTIHEVVLQPGQFVVFPRNLNSEPCELVIEVVREWTLNYENNGSPRTIPANHVFFHAGKNHGNVSRAIF